MKPTIPDVVGRFSDYLKIPGNGSWGSLHIVLDDGNIGNDHVLYCIGCAEENGDGEGRELGLILLSMSKTQRKKLPDAVRAYDARASALEP